MKLIDLHCDTIYQLYKKDSHSLDKNDHHIDLNKLEKADSYIQVFALYDSKELNDYDFKKMQKYIAFYKELILENEETISPIRQIADLQNGKINTLLSIEDGGSVKGDLKKLDILYQSDVRMIGLTWNHENCFGYPNSSKENDMQRGLKPFGFETVEHMNELGMIIDVSHLSDGGFYDVAKTSKVPFIASHSNARTLKNHPRNLTDDMIKILADKGGVCGINFYALFLSDQNISRVSDIVEHIKYIHKIGGIDILAIGSDFDGVDCELEISDISKIHLLIDALLKDDFTESQIEKIFYRNALRVFNEVLN